MVLKRYEFSGKINAHAVDPVIIIQFRELCDEDCCA